jgi:hypothetical protein
MIYELGIILNQELIFQQKYYELKKGTNTTSDDERKILFDIIFSLIPQILENRIKCILNNDYYILFYTQEKSQKSTSNQPSPLFYLICDPKIDCKLLKHLTEQLYTLFIHDYVENLNTPKEINLQFEHFKKQINSILRDEILTPLDRVKRSLFQGRFDSFQD